MPWATVVLAVVAIYIAMFTPTTEDGSSVSMMTTSTTPGNWLGSCQVRHVPHTITRVADFDFDGTAVKLSVGDAYLAVVPGVGRDIDEQRIIDLYGLPGS